MAFLSVNALLVLTLYASAQWCSCLASNILVHPFDMGINSRLMNMERIAVMLADHGHNVTFLLNSRTSYLITSTKLHVVEYSIPKDRKTLMLTDEIFKDIYINQKHSVDVIDFMLNVYLFPFCRSLLENRPLIDSLKEQHFDLFLLDCVSNCGELVADYLDIPTLLYSNYGFTGDLNMFYPAPASFVPVPDIGLSLTDKMTFLERVKNLVFVSFQNYLVYKIRSAVEDLGLSYNFSRPEGSPGTFRRSVIITTAAFSLDYPRPLMPHIIPISGLFLVAPKSLDATWQQLIDNAPKEGVILFSFGSILSPFDNITDEVIAGVFASLPHTVIWKNEGAKPSNLGANTKMVKWFPQNDLLAHPKVKLLITHCGVSSTYEAVKNAVPVVAIPLVIDQIRNAVFLVQRRQMGIQTNFKGLNKQTFHSAITNVLSNETYKLNAIKAAELLRDQPISSKELFLYWVDYVIRHKGAKHLISDAVPELNLLQYHSLDVVAFLLFILLALISLIVGVIFLLLKCVCKAFRNKEDVKTKSE